MSRPRDKVNSARALGLALLVASAGPIYALPASPQITTDGDTLKHHGRTYRLCGIDGPESKQTCPDGWEAGVEATNALAALID